MKIFLHDSALFTNLCRKTSSGVGCIFCKALDLGSNNEISSIIVKQNTVKAPFCADIICEYSCINDMFCIFSTWRPAFRAFM